jgi:hypothetical protein
MLTTSGHRDGISSRPWTTRELCNARIFRALSKADPSREAYGCESAEWIQNVLGAASDSTENGTLRPQSLVKVVVHNEVSEVYRPCRTSAAREKEQLC